MALAEFVTDSGRSATFQDRVIGSQQQGEGPLQRLAVGVTFNTEFEWGALLALRTTRYSVRQSLSGKPIVHWAGGAGVGTLSIPGYGRETYRGILVDLVRSEVVGGDVWTGVATFIVEEMP